MSKDMIQELEARIAQLEAETEDARDPENQRLDNLLRKFVRSIELTAWLGGWAIRIAPIIAGVWFFGEEAVKGLKAWFANVR